MSWPISLPLTRLVSVPLVQTIHHAPSPDEIALWSRYPDARFIAISDEQAARLAGLNVVATIHHALDIDAFRFTATPGDYLLYLGRFTEGKGVLQAIDVARRTGRRLILAAAENDYYRDHVASHVDGEQIVYAGEVGHEQKVALLGGAQALLYPVQAAEPFGLVLIEAMACGTPVAALDRGAVREVVDQDVTGGRFASVDDLVAGLPAVVALDRARVRERAAARFGVGRMVDEYVAVYSRLAGAGDSDARCDGDNPAARALTSGTGL
jgi:glycosyltransferase involved in cell wall biosynthesis